jgi:hypothetical protein
LLLPHPKIQDQPAVRAESTRLRYPAHLFDQPGLSNAGFAANVKDVSGPSLDCRGNDLLKLFELLCPTDKGTSIRGHMFARESLQSPNRDGRFKTFNVCLTERLADTAPPEGAVHAIR